VSQLPKSGPRNLGLRFSAPAFLLGLLAASFQIFLLREFSAQFYGNELTFGLVLAGWLFWGGLGSLWATGRTVNRAGLARLYFAVLILAPLCFAGLRFSRLLIGVLPGEMTGIFTVSLFAFVLTLFLSFPLGTIFVFAVKLEDHLPRVYLWESVAAAAGGLFAYFALIPFFSNWQALALLGSASAGMVLLYSKRKRMAPLGALALAVYSMFFIFDFPSQKISWKPFTLVRSEDSLYGKLQVIKTAEQVTLYDNGLRVYSFPDPASAEEAVHFALLQNPRAERVLLVGGGTGGSVTEILKYPKAEIDYVELDPEIIRLSELFLPAAEKEALKNSRVHVIYADGRAFLERNINSYDIIILNLPEPATAQINRFYTQEFFSEVHEKLKAEGVFSFRLPSAENYISPELQNFLSVIYATLRKIFPAVEVVPGDSNIFLASRRPLNVKLDYFIQTLRQMNHQNRYITPEQLPARLHPLRVRALMTKIGEGSKALNSDLHPISYFFNSVLWSTQFKGLESKALKSLARIPSHWLLDIPLFLFIGLLVLVRLGSKGSGDSVIPVAVMGLTTMAVEIMSLIWFQARFGYVYKKVALLLAVFMIGLALGAFLSSKRKMARFSQLVLLQFGFLMLVLAMRISLDARPAESALFAFLFLLGYLGGDFFIVFNSLFFKEKAQTGLGYGWDLLGSFLAAVSLSAVLIPLAGLQVLFQYLFLMNSFGLLFLVVRRNNPPSPLL